MESLAIGLGPFLKERRERAGLSQKELAERSKTPLRTIQQIEGGTMPRLDTFAPIAKALGISSEELWGAQKRSSLLSKSVLKGPLGVSDGALILSEIEDLTPEQRGFLLAILFRDPDLAEEGQSGLEAALRGFQNIG